MMTSGRWLALALALCTSVPLAASAHAEPTAEDLASARALFKEGRALREKGDLPRALEKLRAAHALGQTPITGLELARTCVLLGKLVEAHEVSLGVSRLPVAGDETGRSDAARAAAAKLAIELEPRLARIVVSVKGLPPGSAGVVSVDGETIPPEAVGEPRSADPGGHLAVLKLPGRDEIRAQVELKEGESRAVDLDATPAPPSPRVVPPAASDGASAPPPRSNVFFVTGATAAGFGLLFGASFGVAALSTKSSLTTDCPGGGCGPAHHDELARAQTEATVSTAGFIVAGVGAGAMVLDLILRRKNETHARLAPELGPGWVGVHGAF